MEPLVAIVVFLTLAFVVTLRLVIYWMSLDDDEEEDGNDLDAVAAGAVGFRYDTEFDEQDEEEIPEELP
jgi:hypothetical protein